MGRLEAEGMAQRAEVRKTGKQKAAGSRRVSELGQKRIRESETKGARLRIWRQRD